MSSFIISFFHRHHRQLKKKLLFVLVHSSSEIGSSYRQCIMRNITILFLVGLVSFSSGFSLAPKSSTSSRNLSSRLSLSTKTETKDSSTAKNEKVVENYATDPSNIQKRVESSSGFSYVEFAKENPFANNLMIATTKTAAADLLAQTVIAQTPLTEVDLQRSFLFCLFGCIYLGAFQYLYQVQVFKKLFDVDKFTSQSLSEKLQDIPGLKALGAQTGLDLTVLTFIYLPTFYIFKASIFSGSLDPSVWFSSGIDTFQTNFSKDEADLIKVWLPADLVCFSVPLYLRLPVRHVVSFVWTAYLSFSRGGH